MRSRTTQLVASSLITAMLAGCGASSPAMAPSEPAAARGAEATGATESTAEAPMQPEYEASADSALAAPSQAAAAPMEPMAPPPAAAPMPQPAVAGAAAQKAPGRPVVTPKASPDLRAQPRPAQAAQVKKSEAKAADLAGLPVVVATPTPEPQGTEHYTDHGVNPVTDPAKDRHSTFAIDVDTASYAIARRKITEGSLPPFQAVRAEEFLNYFDYGYAAPRTGPFAVHLAAAPSPYARGHHLVRVAVQGKRISAAERKPVHLVYLVDTSGSMQAEDRIGLAKKSLRMLTSTLRKGDTVALCTYAGSVREVLPPTGVEQKDRILAAIDDLTAGGSTAMSSGIDLAYDLAQRTLVPGHVNRVIVLSDGDANVGPTSHEEILKTIKRARDKGVTLSTIGYGMGNYKDTMMERLANEGNGNYYYIDSETQARRVFSEQVDGTLEVIARDVKIQVEFDPEVVRTYRLVGYENRDVADRDFRNDKVDAGEIGSGHSVTAIYDVELKTTSKAPVVVRLRHKAPLGSDRAEETLVRMAPASIAPSFDAAPADLRFAAAVTGFAEILRQSPHARTWKMADVERVARGSASQNGDQQEFIALVRRAGGLAAGRPDATVAR